jgi:hypothetical protein
VKKLTPNNIKKFLKTSFLAACFLPFLQFCSKAAKSLIVKISGTNHVLGHQLWEKFSETYRNLNINSLL